MSAAFDVYPLILLVIGIVFICGLILYLRVNAFLALILAALLVGLLSPRVILTTPAGSSVPQFNPVNAAVQITTAFGRMMGQIGIVIALATIVGKAMMDSGAADRIVRSCIRLLGERLTPLALLISSYVLGIPVFFDTVFLLMAPLARALEIRTGRNYILYVCAIAAGASITHSLVPPTPGPLTIAAALHVDLGLSILIGMLVAAPVALAGLGYGFLSNRLWPVSLHPRSEGDGPAIGTGTGESPPDSAARLPSREPVEQIIAAGPPPPAETPEEELPPLWLSVLPVLLPVLLISSSTVATALERTNSRINQPASIAGVDVTPRGVLGFFGNAGVALLISALVGMGIVAWQKRLSRSELGRFTSTALDEAGMILLITSAGGAFGDMLQQVGVGQSLGVLADRWNVSLLVLGWVLAAMLKAAQGSATVAMITTAGILKAILDSNIGMGDQSHPHYASFLGYHPVYLVMAIGCGSKIGSWMNDSGFWVVCKAGGLTEIQALRSWTLVLATMGLVGLPITWLFAWLLPLL